MRWTLRLLVPLGAAALPLAVTSTPAMAHDSSSSFQTTLNPLNRSTGSGMAMITLKGDEATVEVSWKGLPATFDGGAYPHVQHLHIGAKGTCPTTGQDTNKDGVISTTESAPALGPIGSTLSVRGDTSPKAGTDVKIAPGGASDDYKRTIKVSDDVVRDLEAGSGVIVVHGLDPATLSKRAQKESSDLVPSLPLAATSPALCGALTSMPGGGIAAGTGSTSGVEDLGLFAAGGVLITVGGGLFATSRRRRTIGV